MKRLHAALLLLAGPVLPLRAAAIDPLNPPEGRFSDQWMVVNLLLAVWLLTKRGESSATASRGHPIMYKVRWVGSDYALPSKTAFAEHFPATRPR